MYTCVCVCVCVCMMPPPSPRYSVGAFAAGLRTTVYSLDYMYIRNIYICLCICVYACVCMYDAPPPLGILQVHLLLVDRLLALLFKNLNRTYLPPRPPLPLDILQVHLLLVSGSWTVYSLGVLFAFAAMVTKIVYGNPKFM